ncbi:MAG TPA: 5-deoxy-glucuronate isomerase [Planctomycetota bacterium]
MSQLAFEGDARLRTAPCASARWLTQVQLWRPGDPDQITTADVETAVLLLSGTFDLIAGATAWQARGARQTPFQGRPMAVFLPKNTTFRTQRGQGEILLIAARQPQVPPAVQGRAVFGLQPLLPLAGSGKAFDPNSGEWLPAETFPTSAESLPPRRMVQLQVSGCVVERVFAKDYKAATLSIDEVVVPAGQSLAVAAIPDRPSAQELLVFVRSEGGATVVHSGQRSAVRGDAAFCVATTGEPDATIAADGGPAYVVLAYAGKV